MGDILSHGHRTGAALFSLFTVVACNAILGNESSFKLVPKCLLSSDCSGEQICIFATCSKPCREDKDCDRGDRCLVTSAEDATACVGPTQAACSADTCPSGTACSDGACRTVCDEANPCRDDQTCDHAVCVGTDGNHDPGAASLSDAGAAGSMSGGSDSTSPGGEAGNVNGGSGPSTTGNGGSHAPSGGQSNGGTAGKGGGGASGSGATTGSGGTSGSGGSGGAGGMTGPGGSSGSGGRAGSGGAGSGGAGSGGMSGSGGSGGSCSNGTYQCIASPPTSQQCTNGSWGNNQVCTGTTPLCLAGKCAACADGAKDCSSNVPRSCVSGAWQNGTACTGGATCSAGACTCPTSTTACASICSNLQTDGANCGTCGHSCQGGTCSAGKCQPVVIASGQNKPWSIATDGTTLFWVNQGNKTLIRYTLASGTSTVYPSSGNCTSATGGLAVAAGKVWWSSSNATCWVATPATGTPTEITSMWGGTTTELNGVAASVNGGYLVNNSDNWLVSSSPSSTYRFQAVGKGVAADSAGVYWLEGQNLVKQHDASSLGTGTPGILSSGTTTSDGITTYNSLVYFTGASAIYSVPNTPGTPPTPLVAGQVSPSGIAADASGVYWTNRNAPQSGVPLGTVMRAPLAGGTAAPIASDQDDPHGIALDATTVYWTNSAGGQVMKVAK